MFETMPFNWIDRVAIRQALKRPMPESWANSDANNFYSVIIPLATEEFPRFRVKGISANQLTGELIQSDSETIQHTLDISEITDATLNFYQIYGPIQLKFQGSGHFLFSTITLQPQRTYWRYRFARNWGIRRLSFRQDRLEVLQLLVEHFKYSDRDDALSSMFGEGIHPIDAFQTLYGPWAWEADSDSKEFRKFRAIIESLTETGELRGLGSNFEISGLAIATLSNAAVEDKRFKDSLRQTILITILTSVIALSSIAELFF